MICNILGAASAFSLICSNGVKIGEKVIQNDLKKSTMNVPKKLRLQLIKTY